MSNDTFPVCKNSLNGARQRKAATTAPSTKSKSVEKQIRNLAHAAWHDLPIWQQDNEYIHSGYRPVSGSFTESLKSVAHIHNETVNIYSHLIGAILFATLPYYFYNDLLSRYPRAGRVDAVVFSTFFYGVAICFLLSATFHIINNHSEKVAIFGNQLDYLGIVVLMWGSTIPTVYYGFFCNPELQKLYWTMISTLALGCIVATFHPKFRHPTWRPYRVAMYSGLGLSAIIFIVHGILLFGYELTSRRMSLNWMGLMGVFNFTGAGIYAARIPERWHAKKYDIFGSSHQILHVMVIFAGLAHMIGLFQAFDYVHGSTTQTCGKSDLFNS